MKRDIFTFYKPFKLYLKKKQPTVPIFSFVQLICEEGSTKTSNKDSSRECKWHDAGRQALKHQGKNEINMQSLSETWWKKRQERMNQENIIIMTSSKLVSFDRVLFVKIAGKSLDI